MRVAYDGGERRMRGGDRGPQNRFEAAGRAFQKEIAGVVGAGHGCAKDNFAV
jgi:hypothetical protein